jgi:hypothetical protein
MVPECPKWVDSGRSGGGQVRIPGLYIALTLHEGLVSKSLISNASHDRLRWQEIGQSVAGTISTTITATYNLLTQNTTVLDTGEVTVASGAAITGQYVSSSFGWTVTNSGKVLNASYGENGIELRGVGDHVTNNVGGVISAINFAIYIDRNEAAVLNDGTIVGSTRSGIYLKHGGMVSNAAAGSITGDNGVDIGVGSGTVVNAGTILGTNYVGIYLLQGGTVSNAASGSITGDSAGVVISANGGTVVNDGSIAGAARFGIYMMSTGFVTNAASASIRGNVGVGLPQGGTLINAGIIVGKSGTAVSLAGTGYNLLVVDPGAAFSGLVTGGTAASNTLELASATSIGALNGIGTQFTNFGSIVFDPGARWDVSGNTIGFGGTISGFAVGDTIELTGITATGSSYFAGILTLTETSGSVALNIPGDFTTDDFKINNIAAGALISVTCFRAGTRIRTSRGEVPVEKLRKGDTILVQTGDGQIVSQPIVWIGQRSVDCRRHLRPKNIWPVRIVSGTFGPGRPSRDLFLSPDHAVFVDAVLIPVKHLINDRTITQVPVPSVEYFHVELPTHAVLLAEGLPVESYLDVNSRTNFANGGASVELFPDFATRTWESHGCAPLVVTGRILDAVRQLVDAHAIETANAA